MSKPRVAFLGLGIMGNGMARRILAAGFPLTVYNRNVEKAKAIGALGAKIAATARDAAKDAEIIVSMISDDSAARSVWLGESGALAGATRGATLIESSTITVDWVHELDAAGKKAGCELLDAPVTGSKAAAESGELNFLVGGSETTLNRARPVLEAMSKSIIHLGPTGSGAMVKLINNFLCGVHLTSMAEALAFLERTGIDRDKALNVLFNGAPGSPMVKLMSARMTAKDYSPNFLMRLLAKDLGYAMKEASERSVKLTTAQAALNLLQNAIAQGYGDFDMSAVVEPLRKK